jgi:hypothetical protein
MLKPLILISIFSLFTTTSHAGWGIEIGPIHIPAPRFDPVRVPTVGEIGDTVQKSLPVNPKQVECDRVREDADRHRARLNSEISRDSAEIVATRARITQSQTQLKRITFGEAEIVKYQTLLSQFQQGGSSMIISQVELKEALTSLRKRSSDSNFLEMISEIEKTSTNPSLQQLASMTKNYMDKTETELAAMIEGPGATESMNQIMQLVVISQSFVTNQIGSFRADRAFHENSIATDTQNLANLYNRIAQDNAEVAKQNERTACNFHTL